MNRRSRTAFLFPVVLLAAMLVGSQPAAAISDVATGGDIGTWSANDSATKPGGRCEYNSNDRLWRLSARPPKVFARRTGGQPVGWQLRVVKNYQYDPINFPGLYKDKLVYKSGFQKDFATKVDAADFTRKYWTRDVSMDQYTRFKVFVVIRWYVPGDPSAFEGWVKYRYEWFSQVKQSGTEPGAQIYYCWRAPY